MQRIIVYTFLAAALISLFACKKYVEVELPPNQVIAKDAFRDDKTATATIAGIYSNMNSYSNGFANTFGSFLPGMSADEFYYALSTASFDAFKENALLKDESYVNNLWNQPYSFIYQANAILEGLGDPSISAGVTAAVKKQLMGEAKFLRAFCHFYLLNYFGDVPLITNTDYKTNTSLPRTPAAKVYEAIIADLKDAQDLMGAEYPTAERTRANKAVATALLARAYLYTGKWAEAEAAASTVIGNTKYRLLKDLNKVFLRSSEETLLQLQAVNTVTGAGGMNTWEGFSIVPASPTARGYYNLRNELVQAFEPGDLRKASWVNTYVTGGNTFYYPYKYKNRLKSPVEEYSMVIRFAEQYLVRAEARAQQNKTDDALADLDTLRHRAALPDLPSNLDKTAILSAVEQERRVELFLEWGHRWFDLKRTGRATAVLSPIKTKWKPTAVLYPIPNEAIRTNPNLEQNDGYK